MQARRRRPCLRGRRPAVEFLESRTLLAAGDLDSNFGANGKVLTDFPNTNNDAVLQAVLQADGKIVVLTGGEANHSRLARYTANGQLDGTFGTGGSIVLNYRPASLAVRTDNRLVVAGYDAANANNVLLTRYTANGQIDSSFGGGDGQVSQPYFAGGNAFVKQIARLLIRGDDTMYVVGSVETAQFTSQFDFAISSFTPTGDPNPTYGNQFQNASFVDFGNNDSATDAALTPDGQVVAVGSTTIQSSHHPFVLQDFAIARFDVFGVLDPSFSGDGMQTVSFGTYPQTHPLAETGDSFDLAHSVAVDQTNNKVVVAGISRDPTDDDPFFTAVTRLNANGSLDVNFSAGGGDGGDGRARLPLTSASSPFARHDVALLPQEKILIATAIHGATARDSSVARLNANGTFDPTFANGEGRVATDFGGDELPVGDLLIQGNKAILTGGSTPPAMQPGIAPTRLAMARYQLEGTVPGLQTPFGGTPVTLPGTLQFENYDEGGEGVAYHDTDSVNQGLAYRAGGVDIQALAGGGNTLAFAKAGEWTEYTVNVPAGNAGTYDLVLRYASLKGGGKFHFEVDGRVVTPTTTLSSTGSWTTYRTITLALGNLAAGNHVLRLKMDANDSIGYVGNFDSAELVRRTTPSSTPFNGVPFRPNDTIQAEDFDNGGEGVAYHDTESQNVGGAYRPNEGVDIQPTTDTGGGYNVGFVRQDEYLVYSMNFLTGGTFGFQYRAAALKAGGTFHVEIDGQRVATVAVPQTNDWQRYVTVTGGKNIAIAAGRHTLRIVAGAPDSTGYIANFNWFKIYS